MPCARHRLLQKETSRRSAAPRLRAPDAIAIRDPGRLPFCTSITSCRPHDSTDGVRHPLPLGFLGDKMFFAGRSEPVILELPLLVTPRVFPFRRDQTFALQAMKSGIERAVLHLQDIFGGPLDVLCNLMAVRGSKEERAEDQHVQGSLQKVNAVCHIASRQSTLSG